MGKVILVLLILIVLFIAFRFFKPSIGNSALRSEEDKYLSDNTSEDSEETADPDKSNKTGE